MPKVLDEALTHRFINGIDTPGVYADGNGLALKVDKNGNRRWIQRLTVGGKATTLGLGSFPDVQLAEARKVAAGQKLDAQAGRLETRSYKPPPPTFAKLAEDLIAMRSPTWSNERTAENWLRRFQLHVYPTIGDVPVDQITIADVMRILTPVWTVKPETASKLRNQMQMVFDFAVAQGHRPDNPAGKHLLRLLPNTGHMARHHEAMPLHELPGVLRRVLTSSSGASARLGFRFLCLAAVRTGEVIGMRWSEVDWEQLTWVIPAERMKSREPHRVPLSRQLLDILHQQWESGAVEPGSQAYVFPMVHGDGPLSPSTWVKMMNRMGLSAVPHGLRSSFRDWAAETGADWTAAEKCLAHAVGNAVVRSYLRSDLFAMRRGMMQEWADFCIPPEDALVQESGDGAGAGGVEEPGEHIGEDPGEDEDGAGGLDLAEPERDGFEWDLPGGFEPLPLPLPEPEPKPAAGREPTVVVTV